MNRVTKIALLVSVAVHILLWNLIKPAKPELPDETGDGKKQGSGTIKFKPEEIIDKIRDNSPGVAGEEYCPSSFGGIGITTSWDSSVLTVHTGYPAERAGIRPGDVIVTPSQWEIRGKIDSPIAVVVMRNGVMLTFNMRRGKICTESGG